MKPTVTRENVIEKYARVLAEQKGWFQLKIEKANIRGFPDRLFIKDGQTIYIEFKSATGKLRPEQERVIGELRSRGAKVYVASSKEMVNAIFEQHD